jgi:hypothetical protein
MSSPAYLPNTQPKNNSTAQIRRRVNDAVSSVAQNIQENQATQQAVSTLAPQVKALQTPSSLYVVGAQIRTTANAGGASALPATPAGYTTMQLNGRSVKIPFYEI